MLTPEREARMREVISRRQRDLQVVIDHIRDPHNASAILRSCDAFGLHTVNLLYTDQPSPELSAGVSGASAKWLQVRRFDDPTHLVDTLHREGAAIHVTHRGEGARDARALDYTQPLALVFSNEKYGCSPALAALADGAIWIPMVGMVESFNVSVSAAIVLSEAYRQRDAAGRYAPAWSDWHDLVLDHWTARDEAKRLRLPPPPPSQASPG